jgi:predicted Zn-dependent protease
MYQVLKQRFETVAPDTDFCSLRYVERQEETLEIQKDIVQPSIFKREVGAMLTVIDNGGIGYAATSDLSEKGLHQAMLKAQHWAARSRGILVTDLSQLKMPMTQGKYQSKVQKAWVQTGLDEKLNVLKQESAHCHINDKIVDWTVSLSGIQEENYYLTNHGGQIYQRHHYTIPNIEVVANQGINTQIRSLRSGYAYQGGLEALDKLGFEGLSLQLAEEALQLLDAPNCPTDNMDLILMPDQMALQIHESIGHPLELDRILGDERNYAGTSFIELSMFGNYRYGSELLNVSFDPTHPEELASYAFDAEGLTAEKVMLIENGILVRPLGGFVSQARAGLNGVANVRASSWNRPPIDRMANLNVEPGDSSLEDMISNTEKGVLMKTNSSWSIDDSRNKFQFGCEYGQLIENGQLTKVVKNPNYRGISANFWRNLQMVGNEDTFEILGVTNCGKGEPNQVIMVGHASPACLFSQVDVFGGE